MKLIKFNSPMDADKLNYLPFNRKYSVREDLMDKMNKYGFTVPINIIKTNIIDGKNRMWIADGQHRASTALHLGIPFTGILVEHLKFATKAEVVNYVASLNSASKAWNLTNYVEAYNFLNYKDYAILLKIANSSPYTVNTVSSLMIGVRSKGTHINKIKNGTFKVTMLENTQETIKYAANLSKYGRITSRMLLALGYVRSMPTFDKSSFTKKYIENVECIRELNLDDYTDLFQSWIV